MHHHSPTLFAGALSGGLGSRGALDESIAPPPKPAAGEPYGNTRVAHLNSRIPRLLNQTVQSVLSHTCRKEGGDSVIGM
ncbi:hypothetical protein J2Y68_000072 [Paenarthrobacter nitroguajacolicus]|nr:hypothetical protein [Paenarthrobacter nitroguajacolicus]